MPQQNAPTDPISYTLPGASLATGVSVRQLARDVASGALVSFKRGRRRLVLRTDLERWLRGERGESPPATAEPATPAT
jgi:hypothetical protein